MRENADYVKAVETIEGIPQMGKEPGVIRSARLLEALGNPQKSLKIIHVAGTNGKGSVCMYISRILREMGYSVGTFVSPHLVRINERICWNLEPIDDETFGQSFQRVWEAGKKAGDLGYFDICLAMAIELYARRAADYVVLETGLGGRLDGTNAVENPVLSVITSISLDHCALLGDTVEKIAAEKAGIIKRGTPVVWDAQQEEVCRIIKKRAEICQASCVPVEKSQWEIRKVQGKSIDFSLNNRYYKEELFTLKTYGIYQPANAALALTAVNVLFPVPPDLARRALAAMVWHGRMEEAGPDIFVDGAHNPGGMEAFLASVDRLDRKGRQILLFAAARDKNFEEMIRIICKSRLFDGYVVTQVEGARKLAAAEVERQFRKHFNGPVWVEGDAKAALEAALAYKADGRLFIAGSLYLAGKIEAICGEHREAKND